MKLLKISILALLVSILLLSCRKDEAISKASNNNATNNQPLTGTWAGEYKTTARSEAVYFSFDIQPGGVLHLLDETHATIGEGTWSLNDSLFNALYIITATQHSNAVSGVLHAEPVKLDGKWQFSYSYEDAGSWFMEKL